MGGRGGSGEEGVECLGEVKLERVAYRVYVEEWEGRGKGGDL